MNNKKTKIFTTFLSLCLLICTMFVCVGCGAPNGLKPETAFTLEYKDGNWETTKNPTLKADTDYYFVFTTDEDSELSHSEFKSRFAVYAYDKTGKDTKLNWRDFTCEVLNEDLEEEFDFGNPFTPVPEPKLSSNTKYYLKITLSEDMSIRIEF